MNSYFRDNADHGVWCALLLPISIGVSNLKFSTESLSSSSSFYLSACFALYSLYLANTFRIFPFSETSQKENKVIEKTFGSWIFVAASAIVQFFWFPWRTIIVNSLSLAAFVFYLPKLFRKFPKSFTFGEGCLVLQSVLLFVASSDKILFLKSEDGITRLVCTCFSIIVEKVTLRD
jgi:hypothetical protein